MLEIASGSILIAIAAIAAVWFVLASGRWRSLLRLGFFPLLEGSAAVKQGDYDRGFRLLRRAAERGSGKAQFKLGLMYSMGWGTSGNSVEAIKWYRKAAEQGVVWGDHGLGLTNLDLPPAPSEALASAMRAAEAGGDALAVRPELAAALNLYVQAAKGGDALALYSLALMYYHGLGVRRDLAEAANLFQSSAEQNFADSQIRLGLMYEQGEGVPRDDVEAYKWLSLSQSRKPFGYTRAEVSKIRSGIAARMTDSQTSEAQRLIREWEQK